jgi:flagellin
MNGRALPKGRDGKAGVRRESSKPKGVPIMAMSINTNVVSMNAQRNLSSSQGSLATSMQRLSSGLRVNSAKDDAAGIAIAERMSSQVRGMNVGIRNANDAISLSQTAEGTVGKVTDMMQRMRELAVQSANATNSDADRENLDAEFQALGEQIGETLSKSKFNGLAVVGGDAATFTFQVGAYTDDTVDVETTDLSADATITAVTAGGITDAATATAAMEDIDEALTTLNTERAKLGATQSRFESIISVAQVNVENTAAAKGRIVDADFATETANLSRSQILQQAGTAMVAQANQLPQSVLQLLR